MRPPNSLFLLLIVLSLFLPPFLSRGSQNKVQLDIREYDYDGDYRPEGVQRMREIFFIESSSDTREPLDMIVPEDQISGHVTQCHTLHPTLCTFCLVVAMVLHGILGY
ncbi:hypothetical protein XELAEV_18034156mg [Xenopus laevis]|uniref:Uncharacterized protein n=1 Tax=Xenopus laevis TaxID=8355 RepID=A0A974HAU5_XENLA|nr:hypothetical protein XELAEV_18034156mg [Xenopus laevis]